jgi:hypothetical protein
VITDEERRRLELVTGLLLPGDGSAPAATDLPDLGDLLDRALRAVGHEAEVVEQALAALPAEPTWDSLEALDRDQPALFSVLAAVCSGAYFMSPVALDAIGYPHGPRRPASKEQIVDELETGILEPVLERPSHLREVSA